PHTAPACAGSPRPPRDGSTACRSADRTGPPAPHRAAGRASAGTFAPTPPASPPLRPATARPAHAARATPRNASVVPLAALPPGPFPAPLSSGSKTGQITRHKNRTDHASATHEDLDLANNGIKAVCFQLEIALRCDFADVFEVKAGRLVRRGRITTEWSAGRQHLCTTYRNADFVRAVTISPRQSSSKAVYANGRLSFEVALKPGERWHGCL